MRILFVAPWLPSRVRPRSLGLLQILASEHEVHFVGLSVRGDLRGDLEGIPLASVTTVALRRAPAVVRALVALFTDRSLQQEYVRDRRMLVAVRDAVRNADPDLLYLNVIRSVRLVPSQNRCPMIIDLDEIRSDYYEQMHRKGSSPFWRLIAGIERNRMRAAEAIAIERASTVLVSSPADLARLGVKAHLVRSPYQVSVRHGDAPTRSSSVLFVGRMCYPANVEAALRFALGPFVELRRLLPTVRLDIVGERPVRKVRRLSSGSVHVHGFVPDVSPLYASAAVAVVPVTQATGVQMKLVQALAAGVPCVATRSAAQRAGVEPEVHVLVADAPEEWVSQVRRLLLEGVAGRALADSGRRWATEHYSEVAIRDSLRAAVDDVATLGEAS